jgi:hypothetical protein
MANKSKGILLGESGDLLVEVARDENGKIAGGLAVGDVTEQNQRIIIVSEKGDIKDAPLIGVGAASYLDDEDPSILLREVRTNLREDGQKVVRCGFNDSGKLVIIGGYEEESVR